MKQSIVNLADVNPTSRATAFAPDSKTNGQFDMQTASVSKVIGAQKLGYNITVLPPGQCAYPLHNHHVNEEMFLILDGNGSIRIGDTTHEIRKDDVIACPPGGPDSAHQIINTGNTELKYLAVSTMESPEFVEYPDSGKFGVYAKRADTDSERFVFLGREEQNLDYWDGE